MMKMKWLSLVGVFVLLMAVATYLFVSELKLETGLNQLNGQSVVMNHKTWKLTFSKEIDEKTVNEETVYVLDDQGKKIDVNVSLSTDHKTILITPPKDGYDLSKRYYKLHLSKEIKSVHGRALRTAQEIKFVVKEKLPVVGSKENLNSYFDEVMKEEKRGNFFTARSGTSVEESKDSAGSSNNKAESQEYSETNIQVQGVDESDIVKTNGTHIYQVVDGKINIIDVENGKNMKLLKQISYSNTFYPFQLFLHENKLLVLGHSYEEIKKDSSKKDEMKILPVNDSTKAIVYDITDPNNPKEERSISLEGHMVSSRKIDSKVYLVTNQYPQYWIMREIDDVDLRPRYSDSNVSEEKIAIDYDNIQYFPDSKEANYTMIAAFDLEKSSQDAKITTYLGSGNQMYMSKENLYLAVQDWGIRALADGEVGTENTTVYKFSIDGLKVEFDSSTDLEGRILNQFSMDEHNGYFRVAVTKGNMWDEEKPSANHLFIYDKNLKLVSSIEDLARGERIYSARFMGDRIYIVTFRETDPLFVIDAANPEAPKVLGELKIPGFSNYLHPYDENHLIGFGHHTKSVASKDSKEPLILTEGVKLSIFDITDMKNPKEMFTEIIGGRGTYSPLNYDHKAMLFDKKKKLFAFPINVYQSVEGDNFDSKFEFQGAYIYNLDLKDGFTLKSKISHMKGKTLYEEWENEIQRLLYVDNTLYVLSNSKISAHSLKNYELVGELSLIK
ncbi:beta-propeller domain-containing protein [Robertmurraya andreesenii]|uniref:Secreted protein with C-terminal beta-propeller domain n=1 Tax=Anoxybacillus andreesenii TaxID=1325932 RepID=A0ABT9V892_9BACL|nr:beta-propeller domain-containing protein [Robertmurraya andreesenii]MDQ0157168.1 putative secreted protein with C-terminal beta-propeller domain [Robertmurraya andreesenii]